MANDSVEQRVREILGRVLRQDLPGRDQVSRRHQAAWDSLKHLEIVFALEDEFGLRFSEQEMIGLDSLSRIVAIVEAHLAA